MYTVYMKPNTFLMIIMVIISIVIHPSTSDAFSLFQTSSTTDANVKSNLEEVKGVIEGVGTDRLPINVKNSQGEITMRVIRFGNKSAITVTRDKKPLSSVDMLQPADAVVVRYGTDIIHKGTVAQGTSPKNLIIITDTDKKIVFDSQAFSNLKLRYLFAQDSKAQINATVEDEGVHATVPKLKIGTPVEVTLKGESIASIDAYSSGQIPGVDKKSQIIESSSAIHDKKLVLFIAGSLLVLIIGGILYKRK